MTIGENIKKVRKTLGITQKELGSRLNMSQAAIGQYENNPNPPKLVTITKIAQALGVAVDILIDDWSQFNEQEESEQTEYLLQKLIDSKKSEKMDKLFSSLNDSGQDKALEQVELLTKIPEYQKDNPEA